MDDKLLNSRLDPSRYSRHIVLDKIGKSGQEKLLNSKVLIIGAGGLGSPILYYLAAAGIGTLGIADSDKVDISNLQRQILHFTPDIGKSKVFSAKEKLANLNPDVKIIDYDCRITKDNISNIVEKYDFIIEATDNFASKFLINDSCVRSEKRFSCAGVLKFQGQTMTYVPGSACFRCVFTKEPQEHEVESCEDAGLLGVVPGVLGTIQAAEAIKSILGVGELLTNKLLVVDLFSMEFRTVDVRKNNKCVCVKPQSD